MKDKYDEAVAYLKANPREINQAWDTTWQHEAGCLFRPVSSKCSGQDGYCWPLRADDMKCGCLTTIRGQDPGHSNYGIVAETDELTKAIIADERIPKTVSEITVDHLEIFADWQRRIDKELGRV